MVPIPRQTPRDRRPPHVHVHHQPARARIPARAITLLATAGLVALVPLSCIYVVQPTEMAGLRRLGSVATAAPVGPGLHFKLPIDRVDRLQVSLTPFSADDLTVYTVDNQPVRIGIGLTYRVPASSVFKLLYQVGRSGNLDIDATLRPILADRALRVFARHNTVNISREREQIALESAPKSPPQWRPISVSKSPICN